MQFFQDVFGSDFMRLALMGGTLTACLTSYLGVFVVLRRIVFVAVALAEMSALGVAVALWQGWDNPHAITAASFVFTFLGVLLFSFVADSRRLSAEAIIGFTYAAASGLALLALSKSPHGADELLSLMSADVLTVTPGQVQVLAGVTAVVGLVHLVFYKEFLLVSFDPDTASTAGLGLKRWTFLFYLTLGAAIAVTVKLIGILLVFAFLVIPAMTASLLSSRMRGVLVVSVVSALVCTVGGLVGALKLDLPSSPTIVVALTLVFLAAGTARLFLKD